MIRHRPPRRTPRPVRRTPRPLRRIRRPLTTESPPVVSGHPIGCDEPADPPARLRRPPPRQRPRRPLRLGRPDADHFARHLADRFDRHLADRFARHLADRFDRHPPTASTDTSSPATDSKTVDIAPPSSATTEPPVASNDSPPASTRPAERGCKHRVGLTAAHRPGTSDDRAVPLTAAKLRAVVRNSWLDDCRFSVLCGAALLARSPFESAQALFNSWPLREASSTQRGSRSGGDRDRTEGAQPPRVPIPPPAPNHQPDGPTAPGAFFGFGSSGGFHNGGLLALMAVLLGFTFLQSTRRVTPPEQRVHGPLLVLSLERPG